MVVQNPSIRRLLWPTQTFGGAVRFAGEPPGRLPSYARAGRGLGYVPEERRIFPELTVRENLEVAARPGEWSVARAFELFPRLAEIQTRRGGLLSGGEQQMLTVARTLVTNPRLLLLDEPTEGLAPLLVRTIAGVVTELKRSGLPVLLAELAEDERVRELLSL